LSIVGQTALQRRRPGVRSCGVLCYIQSFRDTGRWFGTAVQLGHLSASCKRNVSQQQRTSDWTYRYCVRGCVFDGLCLPAVAVECVRSTRCRCCSGRPWFCMYSPRPQDAGEAAQHAGGVLECESASLMSNPAKRKSPMWACGVVVWSRAGNRGGMRTPLRARIKCKDGLVAYSQAAFAMCWVWVS
jgi:hypothetical protein